ncbi:aminoglycoside phosphotransferase family protein, partial [Prauserella halophila]
MDLSSPAAAATRERLRARFGATAETWWSGLRERLDALTADWELELGEPVGSGNTSLVVRCHVGTRPAILKLTPDAAIAGTEAAALRVWQPSGRVPAVYAEADGALLLEAIPSETTLADAAEDAALRDVAALIRALHDTTPEQAIPTQHDTTPHGTAWHDPVQHDPAQHGTAQHDTEQYDTEQHDTADARFRPQAERTELLFDLWRRRGHDDAEYVAALDRGQALAAELAASTPRGALVHGDLHPGNVLAGGGRGLVAIDPRPCLGDPASDAIDWVVRDDPARWRTTAGELAELIDADADRLWAWCRAFAARLAATDGDAAE